MSTGTRYLWSLQAIDSAWGLVQQQFRLGVALVQIEYNIVHMHTVCICRSDVVYMGISIAVPALDPGCCFSSERSYAILDEHFAI